MEALDKLRVVLVHDWLTGMRGGEKVLEVVARRFPDAPLYTLLHRRGSVCPDIENRPVRTSFLQMFPQVHRYYRYLLPVMPWVAERWRLPDCDLVMSFSHCVAKSARPPAGVPHVCNCFTPMRYAWSMRSQYFGEGRQGLKARLRGALLDRLRDWDRRTSERVTHFIAISRLVQRRIAEYYGRPSQLIYPPVDTAFYTPVAGPRADYYLLMSAFAPYKRLDLAIEACNRLGRPLVVIGSGQDGKRLQSLAGPTVRFLGWQSNEVIRDHLRRCRALLFPGEEDFGIVPLEAQACGTPVIAFGRGGVTETVVPPQGLSEFPGQPPTGLWFEEQTAECLAGAIETFEARADQFTPAAARRQALRFNPERFAEETFRFLEWVVRGGKETELERPAVERRRAG